MIINRRLKINMNCSDKIRHSNIWSITHTNHFVCFPLTRVIDPSKNINGQVITTNKQTKKHATLHMLSPINLIIRSYCRINTGRSRLFMSSFGRDFYQARQIICNYSVGFQINQTNKNTWGIINVAHPRDISYYQNYLT